MYIIPDKKFVFIAAARTGSKSVAQALVQQRGAILVGSHHTIPEDHPEWDIDKNWTVCSAVRNHYDALVSWYFKIERHKPSMQPLMKFLPRFCEQNPDFVRDGELWWRTLPISNSVLRYGWLQADIDTALVKAGMAPVDLPRVLDSKREGAPYQAYYKRPERTWVTNYFAAEIKRCGYKF